MGIIQWMTDRADAAKTTPTPPETLKTHDLLPLLPVAKTAPATLEAAPLLAVAAVAVVASEKTKVAGETENPAGNPAGGDVTETQKPTTPRHPLTAEHRFIISTWLDHIGEHDKGERNRAGRRCQTDPEALAYVLREAAKAGIRVFTAKPTPTTSPKPIPRPKKDAEVMTALNGLPLDGADFAMVAGIINTMNSDDRSRTLAQYRHHWEAARDMEPNEAKKDNAGRRAANTWLRACH